MKSTEGLGDDNRNDRKKSKTLGETLVYARLIAENQAAQRRRPTQEAVKKELPNSLESLEAARLESEAAEEVIDEVWKKRRSLRDHLRKQQNISQT